jgi:hypothetical protein
MIREGNIPRRQLKYSVRPRCCRFWRWSRRERSADIPSDLGQVDNAGPAPSEPEASPVYFLVIGE